MVTEYAHEAIIDRSLFERVQTTPQNKVITMGRTFRRPYLLTGIMLCTNCGYRMIGHPSTGNCQRYLMYTCSGYLRIGKSVCRSVHVLSESLEEVLHAIRERLSSPSSKVKVRETLQGMVTEEFGDNAQSRAEDLKRQLDAITRQKR
jgi:hypothetical protein